MNELVLQQINDYIRNYFFYIEYPNGVDKYFWKDEQGNYNLYLALSDDQIKKYIKRIELDINRFDGCRLNKFQDSALSAIVPLALELKKDLEYQLKYKAQTDEEIFQSDLTKILERTDPAIRRPKHTEKIRNPLRKIPLTIRLPKWMADHLTSEGDVSEVLESYLSKYVFTNKAKEKVSLHDKPAETSDKPGSHLESARILNSSLNAILGFAQLALAPYEWPRETMNKYLASIEKTSQRMKNEVKKLFNDP
jgi:hypothetical protein